ncbi:MAG: hypothetical protein ACYTGH_22100 [Planctomycetota bacterium]|jgi:hypothetical protein
MTPNYTIENHRGKPALMAGNEVVPGLVYCDPLHIKTGPHEEMHHRFAKAGCRTYIIEVRGDAGGDWLSSPFWPGDNEFPDYTDPEEVAALHVVQQARVVLEAAPDARFWIRTNTTPPKSSRPPTRARSTSAR